MKNELYPYEEVDYMKRQPRAQVERMNYNFEQFRKYTHLYDRAKRRDEEESQAFFKLVKYVKEKRELGHSATHREKMIVRDFLSTYDVDRIEIPEKYQDLEASDAEPKRKAKSKRPRIYTRSNKSLVGYDVWRCFDRELPTAGGKDKAACKLLIPPALLIKAFGQPAETAIGFAGSGHFDFEDTNLDLFRIHDYKQTDFYHGLPREDSYYNSPKNLRRSERRRARPWPTVEEFWRCEEPKQFRLLCSHLADWRKFRRWLRLHLRKMEDADFDYDAAALGKFGSGLDICLADFDKAEEVHTDVAAFKWSHATFMSEAELKALPEDRRPAPLVPPVMFDLSKAERVVINKSDLKVNEIQAEQETLSNFF